MNQIAFINSLIISNKIEIKPNEIFIQPIETILYYKTDIANNGQRYIHIISNLNHRYHILINNKIIDRAILDELLNPNLSHKHKVSFINDKCQIVFNYIIHTYSETINIELDRYVMKILKIDIENKCCYYKYNNDIYEFYINLDINCSSRDQRKRGMYCDEKLITVLLNDIKNGTYNNYMIIEEENLSYSHNFYICYKLGKSNRYIRLHGNYSTSNDTLLCQ